MSFGALGLCSVFPATAATKCLKLPTSATICSGSYSDAENKFNWSVNCNGTNITGVGVCAQGDVSSIVKRDIIYHSQYIDTNKYCWCKMVSPGVSAWVYAGGICNDYNCFNVSAENCSQYCAFACAKHFIKPHNTSESQTFKSLILSSPQD